MRPARHALAQFRILCGSARRLHRGDRRRERTRCHGRSERRCVYACGHAGERNLHRYRVRRCRVRDHRCWWCAPPASRLDRADLCAEITGRFLTTLATGGAEFDATQSVRRELVRRAIGLGSSIDEALGESSQLRYHSMVLDQAVNGLFAGLASWRTAAVFLVRQPLRVARPAADRVLTQLPPDLRATDEPGPWLTTHTHLRRAAMAAARRLIALPARTPALRPCSPIRRARR